MALMEGIRERDTAVRRRSMAALGELLFYIASQNSEGANGDDVEGEAPAAEEWIMPANTPQVLPVLSRSLRACSAHVIVGMYVCVCVCRWVWASVHARAFIAAEMRCCSAIWRRPLLDCCSPSATARTHPHNTHTHTHTSTRM